MEKKLIILICSVGILGFIFLVTGSVSSQDCSYPGGCTECVHTGGPCQWGPPCPMECCPAGCQDPDDMCCPPPGVPPGVCDIYCSDPINNPEPANIHCVCSPIATNNLEDFINTAINYIFWFATILMPILIIIGGFYFLTSGGEYEKVNTGKRIITYTIIGYAIILFSRALVYLLPNILGQ